MCLPGAVGDLHADAVAPLAAALRSGVIAGSRPAQTGARAASVIVATRGPARPGAEASVDSHITDLLAMKGDKNKIFKTNGFSQKVAIALD